MSPSTRDIRDIFDRIAPVYDRLNDWLSLGQHRIWKRMAVKWARPQPGDRALDLCCGSGDLALMLADAVGPRGSTIGADFAPQQLAIAAERAARAQLSISWVQADALALPFADNSFDCATVGYGLRNVVDLPQCLGELRRVLKPGGTLAALDFHRPDSAIARQFQQWYLDRLVVPTAEQIGLTEEYAYIAPSLERFPVGSEQVGLARAAGFANPKHYPIAGGMMGVLVAS
ncbi:ubiquinone/menaquinone biosynthesis methyltransferase [Rubidibacter lacunae KORDI 51-2]|uniref:2-phytyl-1,4-naphtoquinone methyltransferase n=1 Tax=Rubidibacter lacunae KORDI 51-2 TaxID=582515 RepID=U5DSX1_9CHRO|nr:bifunctional demethylmenaquinone methyltransferase/2-methoxy-6-polyprenyl-1,4-benzoquinol methylase UbiE [Rubidibacter lacunae]ERN42785.1 ubiquinone/menaquinone biosynthesis methyltransferase [Rubidibacter lacunae KORDI 51-2]